MQRIHFRSESREPSRPLGSLTRLLVRFKLKSDPLLLAEAQRLEKEGKFVDAGQAYERLGKKFRFDAFRCYKHILGSEELERKFTELLAADCETFTKNLIFGRKLFDKSYSKEQQHDLLFFGLGIVAQVFANHPQMVLVSETKEEKASWADDGGDDGLRTRIKGSITTSTYWRVNTAWIHAFRKVILFILPLDTPEYSHTRRLLTESHALAYSEITQFILFDRSIISHSILRLISALAQEGYGFFDFAQRKRTMDVRAGSGGSLNMFERFHTETAEEEFVSDLDDSYVRNKYLELAHRSLLKYLASRESSALLHLILDDTIHIVPRLIAIQHLPYTPPDGFPDFYRGTDPLTIAYFVLHSPLCLRVEYPEVILGVIQNNRRTSALASTEHTPFPPDSYTFSTSRLMGAEILLAAADSYVQRGKMQKSEVLRRAADELKRPLVLTEATEELPSFPEMEPETRALIPKIYYESLSSESGKRDIIKRGRLAYPSLVRALKEAPTKKARDDAMETLSLALSIAATKPNENRDPLMGIMAVELRKEIKKDPTIIPFIIRGLDRPIDDNIFVPAYFLLRDIGDVVDISAHLISAMSDPRPAIRHSVTVLITEGRQTIDQRYIPAVVARMKDSHPQVRSAALSALWLSRKNPTCQNQIILACSDPDKHIKQDAIDMARKLRH